MSHTELVHAAIMKIKERYACRSFAYSSRCIHPPASGRLDRFADGDIGFHSFETCYDCPRVGRLVTLMGRRDSENVEMALNLVEGRRFTVKV